MNDEPECWLYERGRERVVLFERLRGGTLRGKPGWTETPLYSPEAAERIKSLLAEVERLNAECEQRVSAYIIAHDQAMSNGEALMNERADRQRMREALGSVPLPAPAELYTRFEQRVLDWARQPAIIELLNPASKEVNDG